MFPLKNTEAYIHANGFRSTLGKELADRDAEIYEIKSEIQALTNYVADNNVKNILPETIATQTNRGVTFTVNSDGSITLSGTCNATASVTIAEAFNIKAGDYVYVKGATTGSAAMYLYDTATFAEIAPTADHVEFNIASDRQITARFYIINGTTYNATVYPMIVAKSVYDADPTYQPYAKTNVELTQDVAGLTAKSFTKITDSEYANEILFAKSGTSKIVQVSTPKGIAANTNVEIAIPSGYTSEVAIPTGSLASFTSDFVISGGKIRMSINNAGNLELRSSIAITSAIDEILYMPYI